MIYLIGMCVAGLAVLILGAELLTRSAVLLSQQLHVPPIIIGLTVVALGTSTPELAVGIDAALKGQGALAVANIAGTNTVMSTIKGDRDVAIGNLLGSSVYNICIILGITCVIPATGLEVAQELLRWDIPIMVAVAIACVPIFRSGRRVSQVEGGLLVGAYLTYLVGLLLTRL